MATCSKKGRRSDAGLPHGERRDAVVIVVESERNTCGSMEGQRHRYLRVGPDGRPIVPGRQPARSSRRWTDVQSELVSVVYSAETNSFGSSSRTTR